ncbi:MAG TPA: hypothetical protein VI861_02825 [Rickettsiales bacterium]|nr:hypothetical protein [Rickettsiales bacterium]
MTKKSKFLKSTKLAIASIVLTSGVSACDMTSGKHNCMFKSKTQEEKASCSAKHSCSTTKEGKMNCSSTNKAQ